MDAVRAEIAGAAAVGRGHDDGVGENAFDPPAKAVSIAHTNTHTHTHTHTRTHTSHGTLDEQRFKPTTRPRACRLASHTAGTGHR